MKIYEIIDNEYRTQAGVLLYYEKSGDCIIELDESLDEWTAPLLFTNLVKRGIYTVPRELSFLWVKERVIPHDRQNISSILASHKLKSYDEMKLLELSEGKCSQDAFSIRLINITPQYVLERQKRNLTDVVMCDEFSMICFFADGLAKRLNIGDIKDFDDADKIIGNKALYRSGHIFAGGYGITFNNSIDIPAKKLYDAGTELPVSLNDFLEFSTKNILDTKESCEILECTRQNLSYLAGNGRITPIKKNVKGNLYLKGSLYLED